MIVIISYEVENFVVQSWNFVQIQFLVFWLEKEEYCHSKFFNEGTRNNKFESTYFGDTNVLSDSFEFKTRDDMCGTQEPTLIWPLVTWFYLYSS